MRINKTRFSSPLWQYLNYKRVETRRCVNNNHDNDKVNDDSGNDTHNIALFILVKRIEVSITGNCFIFGGMQLRGVNDKDEGNDFSSII